MTQRNEHVQLAVRAQPLHQAEHVRLDVQEAIDDPEVREHHARRLILRDARRQPLLVVMA